MPHDKSPENDGLTKEFFKTFWSEVKKTILSCTLHSFGKQELCTSQRQAIIKLIERKDKDKRIKNWRPIVLPSLISDNQSTYVDRRFISKGGHLIADVLQVTDML